MTISLSSQYSQKNIRDFESLTPGSDYLALWKCDKGHEYSMRFSSKFSGQGCPICLNRTVLKGFNDLATTHPDFAKQWSSRNFSSPSQFTYGSGKKVWWVCDKGHEWETKIYLKVNNNSQCPYCANKKVLSGFNDITTTHPNIVNLWHPTKNLPEKPENFVAGSRKKVWWLGECGHEWETPIHSKVLQQTSCPKCKPSNNLLTTHPLLTKEWSPKNIVKPEDFTYGSETKTLWVCENKHEWSSSIRNRTSGKGCPQCSATNFSSKPEKELQDFIISLGLKIDMNTKNIIAPYELDIYVPELQIAVEFNGLYWHDENHKPKSYHYDKWKACNEKGVQLIQVWEDDWRLRKGIVKSSLARKLGKSNLPKVFARKTFVQQISSEQSNTFLNCNHVQGYVKGSKHFGLFNENELVAVCVVTIKNNIASIDRYATNKNVIGGFTKLITYLEKTCNVKKITTFSDNSISNGGLYANNGFNIVNELKPDYMYIVKGERKHKFGYRLKRFKNDPDLVFIENATEKELASVNNLSRIWDAGKIKWEKVVF